MSEIDQYGFSWGPMRVHRLASIKRGAGFARVLGIDAGWDHNHNAVEVYVSPTGKSVRVYLNGKELR